MTASKSKSLNAANAKTSSKSTEIGMSSKASDIWKLPKALLIDDFPLTELVTCLDEKKAESLTLLDLREISILTDFYLICCGMSPPHTRALAQAARLGLKELGIAPTRTDGDHLSGWIVIDYGSLLLHVMSREMRERYDIESLWGDAPRFDFEEITKDIK